jgi:hypothetical protein
MQGDIGGVAVALRLVRQTVGWTRLDFGCGQGWHFVRGGVPTRRV